MISFELSVCVEAFAEWGVKEGVREIFTNAVDAEHDGYIKSIEYDDKHNSLTINSLGSILRRNSLLIGKTTKKEKEDQIGEFGEGYKFGTLALLRNNKRVSIFNRNAKEKWIAEMRWSEKYQDDVLAFIVHETSSSENKNLTFQIDGITPDEWRECQSLFLNLGSYRYKTHLTTYGEVLEGADVKGKLFVDGVFIQHHEDLEYGYNFKPKYVELDHNRGMVASWSLSYNTAKMWNDLATQDQSYIQKIEDMLYRDAFDVSKIDESYVSSKKLRDDITERFIGKHGKDVHPVSNNEDFNALEYIGIKPIVTGKTFTSLLNSNEKIGSVSERIDEKSKIPSDFILLEDLSVSQQENYKLVVFSLVKPEVAVSIADFYGVDTEGYYDRNKDCIYVSHNILRDLQKTLITVVRAYAHKLGSENLDNAERKLWADIVLRK